MEVHNTLGNGFQEVIYQRALGLEFTKRGLGFVREEGRPISYKDTYIGKRRVDFLVEDKVLVEIKAQGELNNAHLAQTLNYLRAFNLEIGLLINFGTKSVQFRRLINTP